MDAELDRLPGIAVELGRVLEQVPDGALQARPVPAHDGAVGVDHDLPAAASSHPLGRMLREPGQRHRLLGLLAAPGEGQLDELVDQVGELAGLALDVGDEALARRRRELGEAAQHARVGAQAGQRGAQLVGGVLDEPVLRLAGGGQPFDHRRERGGEPPRCI